jgi:hypothetical protein
VQRTIAEVKPQQRHISVKILGYSRRLCALKCALVCAYYLTSLTLAACLANDKRWLYLKDISVASDHFVEDGVDEEPDE